MKLDYLEFKGLYNLPDRSYIKTVNKVYYEDGDNPKEVIDIMIQLQREIMERIEDESKDKPEKLPDKYQIK